MDRLTECVALEEAAHGLRAYAVAPGVIDTDMQALIRATPAARFPDVARFAEMKRDEPLQHAGLRRRAASSRSPSTPPRGPRRSACACRTRNGDVR